MNTQDRLMEIIEFQYPGLEKAAESAANCDKTQALHAIAEHFRTREKPVYLFNRNTASFASDSEIIEEAERTMRHYIFGYQFEGPIKWDFNPTLETSKDNERTWSLWRHIYWQPLARAYALTGDEKYVKEFGAQLRSFYESCPAAAHIASPDEIKTPFPGQPWRNIETAMRIRFTEGKHVIPVPSIEITRSYPQIVYDSMKILKKNSPPGKKQSYEKTIVRPEFSRPDKEEISEEAITQMVKHSIGDYDPVIKVKKARGVKNPDSTYSVYITLQLPLRHYMSTTISDLQEYITECLEKFGGILLKNVSIEIEEWG